MKQEEEEERFDFSFFSAFLSSLRFPLEAKEEGGSNYYLA